MEENSKILCKNESLPYAFTYLVAITSDLIILVSGLTIC